MNKRTIVQILGCFFFSLLLHNKGTINLTFAVVYFGFFSVLFSPTLKILTACERVNNIYQKPKKLKKAFTNKGNLT